MRRVARILSWTLIALAVILFAAVWPAVAMSHSYVYVRQFDHPLVGPLIAGLLASVGIALRLPPGDRRATAWWFALVMVVGGGCFGIAQGGLPLGDLETHRQHPSGIGATIARSPHYTIAYYRDFYNISSPLKQVFLRRRDGLLTREGSDPLACFLDAGPGVPPQLTLTTARIDESRHAVVFGTGDGLTVPISYDPKTLTSAPGGWGC